MKATHGTQSNYDDFMHRRSRATEELQVDPLDPEHEAIGRVFWVKLDNICTISLFPLGGSDPRVVWKIKNIIEITYL
jgi:hypothetical protein